MSEKWQARGDCLCANSDHVETVSGEGNSQDEAERNAIQAANLRCLNWNGTRFGEWLPGFPVFTPPDPPPAPNPGRWEMVPDARLRHISVGAAGHVWGVSSQEAVFRWDGGRFVQLPGALLKQVAVGAGGHVFGVSSHEAVFWWDGGRLVQMGGRLNQVAVGAGGAAWGITSQETVYQRRA